MSTDTQTNAGQAPLRSGPTVEAGTRLGRYRVVGTVGAGGMGAVYLADDDRLGRQVAVKVLRPSLSEGADPLSGGERLVREAQALAQLSHPNVVAVYDVGRWEGRVFVAMEYVPGVSLEQWLADARAWPEVLDRFVDAGRGLAAAHAADLVHRDFKPSNVLVGSDGRVRVVDFGLARETALPTTLRTAASAVDVADGDGGDASVDAFANPLTEAGTVLGTPTYMAPEQHRGDPVTAHSDQFAFCVALYEALYRRRPYTGKSVAELYRRKRDFDIAEPPSEAGVPRAVHQAVLRGLAPRPDDRFATMDALLQALHRGGPRRVWPAVTAGAALIGATGIAVAVVAWPTAAPTVDCTTAGAAVANVWSPAQRQQMGAAFEAAGPTYAAATFELTAATLDAYADRWRVARTAACEHGARMDPEDAAVAAAFDRRIGCLDGRLAELSALVGLLARADASVVQRSVAAASRLSPVPRCEAGSSKALDDPAAAVVRDSVARAKSLAAAGKFVEAVAEAEVALHAARPLHLPAVEAEALVWLGIARSRAGDYEQAQQSLEQAVLSATSAQADAVAARAAIELVKVVGFHRRRPDEGMDWARHAEAALARADAGSEDTAHLQQAIASAHMAAGDFDKAGDALGKAVTVWSERFGADDLRVGTALANLGNVIGRLDRHDEAEQHLRRALAIYEARLGSAHPSVGKALRDLGNVRYYQGEYEDALHMQQRAVALLEASLGPDHPHVGSAVGDLASTHLLLGHAEQAAEHYRRALSIHGAVYGPDHPNVAGGLSNVATAELALRNWEEARTHAQRALEIFQRAQGDEHPGAAQMLATLASAQLELGEIDLAHEHYERALALLQGAYGPNHREVVWVRAGLGDVARARNDHGVAREHYARSLEAATVVFGAEHPEAVRPLLALAQVDLDVGAPAQAVERLQRGLAILGDAKVGPVPRGKLEYALAQALWDTGQRARAQTLAKRAIETVDAHDRKAVRAWLRAHP